MAAVLNTLKTNEDLVLPQEETSKRTHWREAPLKGEKQEIWAIQGPAGPETRQPLPGWIADPVQKRLMKWSEDKRKWEELVAARDGALTKLQRKKYDEWQQQEQTGRLLFDKKKQKPIVALRANASIKNVMQNFISVEVRFSSNPSELTIKAGHNEPWQLVLLQREVVEQEGDFSLPDFLDAGVDEAVVADLQSQQEGHELAGSEDEDGFLQAQIDEADAAIEEEFLEIMAESSDEDAPEPATSVKRVRAFHHREAYVRLESKGLTMLPKHKKGLYLGFHSTTNTWQGFYDGCHSGLSFTFGGKTNRSLTK